MRFLFPVLMFAVLGCTFDRSAYDEAMASRCDDGGCAQGLVCVAGWCREQELEVSPDADLDDSVDEEALGPCGPCEFSCCGLECVDRNADARHCGSCDFACGPQEICVQGGCTCQVGFAECVEDDDLRCETQVADDPRNCGSCSRVCATNELCVDGECRCGAQICAPGSSCCEDGHCAALASSVLDCGGCGVLCGVGESCVTGECRCGAGGRCGETQACCLEQCQAPSHFSCGCGALAGCDVGQSCCGAECVDPATDNRHCGGCDQPCNGDYHCAGGSCVENEGCQLTGGARDGPLAGALLAVLGLLCRRRRRRPAK